MSLLCYGERMHVYATTWGEVRWHAGAPILPDPVEPNRDYDWEMISATCEPIGQQSTAIYWFWRATSTGASEVPGA